MPTRLSTIMRRQSRDALQLLIQIIDVFAKRAEDEKFRCAILRAYRQLYGRKPDVRSSPIDKAFYYKFFNQDRHRFYGALKRNIEHGRLPISIGRLKCFSAALKILGCRSSHEPTTETEDQFSVWLVYLRDVRNKSSVFIPLNAEVAEDDEIQPATAAAPIIAILENYGCAAIVGDSNARTELATKTIEASQALGWGVLQYDTSYWVKSTSRSEKAPKFFIGLWIKLLRQLTEHGKKPSGNLAAKLRAQIREFLSIWSPINTLPSERYFISKLTPIASNSATSPWAAFGKLLTECGPFEDQHFVADLARIVRIGSGKTLIVFNDIRELDSARETSEALFGAPSTDGPCSELRLLVTSQNQDVLAFWETNAIKLTYRIDEHVTHSSTRQATPSKPESAEPTHLTNLETVSDGLELKDPRVAGAHLRQVGQGDSLRANVARDRFQERGADIAFLKRFISSPPGATTAANFGWTLVTGPAGAGKTRLAIEFLDIAEAKGFNVGFLPLERATSPDVFRWRPHGPTFVVIDYSAESPAIVGRLLKEFSSIAAAVGFQFPVRLLLLEREASGEWLKTVVPEDSSGENVRSFRYWEERRAYELTPLSEIALHAIMRGRLQTTDISDWELSEVLFAIDPYRPTDSPPHERKPEPKPRPLFAAAVAVAMEDLVSKRGDVPNAIKVTRELEKKDVLLKIIEREREHFWLDGYCADHHTEKARLARHENLLVVATIALDLSRQKFEAECPEASRKYLPDWESFDADRYRRMAGGDPLTTFRRLEPDILGEFFVLDRLKRLTTVDERQALINAGLSLGGTKAAQFVIRCAKDFCDAWRDLGFLEPSTPGPAMRAFAEAAIGLTELFDEHQLENTDSVISRALKLAEGQSDLLLHELVAKALFNKGVRLGRLGQLNEAITVYDEVVKRFRQGGSTTIQGQVGYALLNQGCALGQLGLNDEAIAIYDSILSRHGASRELALQCVVAKALLNKGAVIGNMNRNDEAIAIYNKVLSRYDAANDPALCHVVAWTLLNKGHALNRIGLEDEAIAEYDNVVKRFDAAADPRLRAAVGEALFRKGCLAEDQRNAESIATYNDIVQRYGNATQLRLRQLVVEALYNQAVVLSNTGRIDEAIGLYEKIVKRYLHAPEPELYEPAALAQHNLRIALGQEQGITAF